MYDGFYQGTITLMDVALQRPIIVTTLNVVKPWGITRNCDYYKTICVIGNNDYTTRIQMSNESPKAITVYSSSLNEGHLLVNDKCLI